MPGNNLKKIRVVADHILGTPYFRLRLILAAAQIIYLISGKQNLEAEIKETACTFVYLATVSSIIVRLSWSADPIVSS